MVGLIIVPTLQRGNAVLDAPRHKEDAGASGTACDAERRTMVGWVIVPTLQRGNAFPDALRHGSAPRRST
ncbi:DUF1534 domain-containing protein [Pseudomonas caricapapayae]|nr:DUF1534 domain-containing protein [Pseudomonas caricapapayae]